MLAERIALPERQRQAGLDAVCRSHRGEAPPPKYHIAEGFVLAHRGAGIIASLPPARGGPGRARGG